MTFCDARPRHLLFTLAMLTSAVGCGGSSSPTSPSPPQVTARTITLAGYEGAFTALGQTKTLRATLAYSDGRTEDITATATWTSDATSVATVAGGVVTARSPGDATISALHQGLAGTQRVSVDAPREALPAITGRLEVTRSPEPAYWFRSMVIADFAETGGSVGYSVNFINVAWYDYTDALILFHNYDPGQLAEIWGTNYIAAGSSRGIRTWIDYNRTVSRTRADVEISISDDFGQTRTYKTSFSDAVSLMPPAGTSGPLSTPTQAWQLGGPPPQ